MEIKILGSCCAKCNATFSVVERVIRDNHLDVKLAKVTDMMEIMSYNVMMLPAVVVDGEVRIKGRVPLESEVKELLGL